MNYTRIYSKEKFIEDKLIYIKKDSSKHLTHVLRKKKGSIIELFDGMGSSCIAEIASIKKNQIAVRVLEKNKFSKRQGVKVFLGQSLIKSEPFSLSIQKATELGVESISPIYTERTVVKVKKDSKIHSSDQDHSKMFGEFMGMFSVQVQILFKHMTLFNT